MHLGGRRCPGRRSRHRGAARYRAPSRGQTVTDTARQFLSGIADNYNNVHTNNMSAPNQRRNKFHSNPEQSEWRLAGGASPSEPLALRTSQMFLPSCQTGSKSVERWEFRGRQVLGPRTNHLSSTFAQSGLFYFLFFVMCVHPPEVGPLSNKPMILTRVFAVFACLAKMRVERSNPYFRQVARGQSTVGRTDTHTHTHTHTHTQICSHPHVQTTHRHRLT